MRLRQNRIEQFEDVHVALTAITAQVDYLRTQAKDFTDPSASIKRRIGVILPETFLREHMGWTSEQLEAIRYRTWDDLKNLGKQ